MSGVGSTTSLTRSRPHPRSSIVTFSAFAALIFGVRRTACAFALPARGSMVMLMGGEAALGGRAEGTALEFDLDALAALPVEVEQQIADRALLDRVDERGDLGRIGWVDSAGLGGLEAADGDELARPLLA